MKNVLIILSLSLFYSCSFSEESEKVVLKKELKEGECPKGHTDEVIPIIYGFPTKEAFQKSDSGLVILAGCILPENPKYYYCKKHQIEF